MGEKRNYNTINFHKDYEEAEETKLKIGHFFIDEDGHIDPDEEGHTKEYATGFQMERLGEGEAPTDFLRFTDGDLQALFNELYVLGFRPSKDIVYLYGDHTIRKDMREFRSKEEYRNLLRSMMITVSSSNIQRIGYSTSNRKLLVEFKSDAIYEYHKVPAQVYESLRNADSVGSYFYKNIRGNYSYRKLI